MFSGITGDNPLKLWKKCITANNGLGINACKYENEAQEKALQILQKQGIILCADISSILIIKYLGIEDLVLKSFGKLKITQSTFNVVENAIQSQNPFQHPDFPTLIELQELEQWILKNCEISPCVSLLDISTEDKIERNRIYGQSFFDTLILTKELNAVLLSEDAMFRLLAEQEYEVKGIWTQALLAHFCKSKQLSDSKYSLHIAKLLYINYQKIPVNHFVIYEALKDANWSIQDNQIKKIIEIIKEQPAESNQLLFRMIIEFLYKLYTEQIIHVNRESIVRGIVYAIMENRDKQAIEHILVIGIKYKFHLLPLDEDELINIISNI